jgi:hypothetical protein
VADLLAKETKDFDFHRIQTRDQVMHLTFNRDADALNAFQPTFKGLG